MASPGTVTTAACRPSSHRQAGAGAPGEPVTSRGRPGTPWTTTSVEVHQAGKLPSDAALTETSPSEDRQA